MRLHSRSSTPFDARSFRSDFSDPPPEYRGAPFWSWNDALDPEMLIEQVDRLCEMGFGGAHAHVRTGLRTSYLSPEFLDALRAVAEHQARSGRLLWLYDEDRWPSGSAGGLVTKDHPELRRRALLLTRVPDERFVAPPRPDWHGNPRRSGHGELVARYGISLRGPRLASWRRLGAGEASGAGEQEWFAYIDVEGSSSWYNGGAYVDTMNPAAIARFAELTHRVYAASLGDLFGTAIPSIFTDEPQTMPFEPPIHEAGSRDLFLAWTGDFAESYRRRFGTDPLDDLPEVVWDLEDGSVSPARWRYHEHRSERFAAAFSGTLGDECERLGLGFAGHLMAEDTLRGQIQWTGESMRSYARFDIPGIDLLCDAYLPATAKQAVSVARQRGIGAVLAELYGVTGWHFDFTGHKRQGDWLAALGITVRVPHLSWMSMEGEAKRDYPAPIDWHSPWWREYRRVEEHFARLNLALIRGKAVARIAILHPVESAWLDYGPASGSGAALVERDHRFLDLAAGLVDALLDFDYVAESLLESQLSPRDGATLGVGEMSYEAVVLPSLTTLRRSTLAALRGFRDRGGLVIVVGDPPRLVEAEPDPSASWLATCPSVPAGDLAALVARLESLRILRALRSDGSPACSLVSQVRAEGEARWLFVCDRDRSGTGQGPLRLGFAGAWTPLLWDSFTGEEKPLESRISGGWTEWDWESWPAGHQLVRLEPVRPSGAPATQAPTGGVVALPAAVAAAPRSRLVETLQGPWSLRLDEPHVLVIDRAEYRLAGEEAWSEPTEILRLDNISRARLGLEPVSGEIAQPWTQAASERAGIAELRFFVSCDEAVAGARIALEGAATSSLRLDGAAIPLVPEGFWVDESIETVALPALAAGEHEFVLAQEIRPDTTREWLYLLGDFGVRVDSSRRAATLVAAPRLGSAGDLVPQGLPFYAGNLELETEIFFEEEGDYSLELGPYAAPTVSVATDSSGWIPVSFPPYACPLGRLSAGKHRLRIRIFGDRANAFGPLHFVVGEDHPWLGPAAYRSSGARWSDAWQLRAHGLLSPPRLIRKL